MKKFPTPNSAAFLSTISSSNYSYVYMGELNENHYNDFIIERYKGVQKTGNKSTLLHYKTYDWVNNDYKIELKSRNNYLNTYNTTIIGYNKVKDWQKDKTNRKYFFLFAYLDGLYEWELNKENYQKIGGNNSIKKNSFSQKPPSPLAYSTFNENKEHLYIPIKELKKISDKSCLVPDELLCKSIKNITNNCCLI